jgi:mRNA-degrading endonuclease RelE of RelBE toxin-antitoxin system
MSYKLNLSDRARNKLKYLDRQDATRILRKLTWVAENAAQIEHERLKNPPAGMEGVCKYRIGPYRAVYWIDHEEETIATIDIVWRKGDYKELYR